MEFEEVNNYINREQGHSTTSLDQIPSFEHVLSNPYNALFQTSIQKKPTLSNFVHRLRQQSSKTRFVREYKKMASLFDTVHTHEYDESSDDASVRIIDKSVMDKPSDPDANDLEVLELVVPKRQKEKKKVMINESANQIRHAHEPQLDSDQFISMDHALGLLHHHVQTMQDNIEKEIKRIRVYQEDIVKYREHMILMDTQLDTMHYSLTMMHKDIPEMKAQKERVQENEIKVRSNQKKHNIQKHRFEKYRKAISIDTRLVELKKKIDAAWKRDEIWASIRDWGLLSVILMLLVTTLVLSWWGW